MPTTTNTQQPTGNPLYAQASQLLQANPGMGKGKLAKSLAIKTPTARRLIERYRGQTQGPNRANPDYVRVEQLKQQNPNWGPRKIAQALGMTEDHAKLHLARWLGVQSYVAPTSSVASPTSPEPEAPAAGSTLQDSISNEARDLCCRSPHIRTLEDLMVYAQVDTRTWEVERHVINRWEVGARGPSGEILTSPLWQIKVWLRRRLVEERLEELFQKILAEFRKAAPERPQLPPPTSGEGLLELSIMDLHLGKIARGAETRGRDYDATIAERMFWSALEDLLAKSSSLKPAKILFVVGNQANIVEALSAAR